MNAIYPFFAHMIRNRNDYAKLGHHSMKLNVAKLWVVKVVPINDRYRNADAFADASTSSRSVAGM